MISLPVPDISKHNNKQQQKIIVNSIYPFVWEVIYLQNGKMAKQNYIYKINILVCGT